MDHGSAPNGRTELVYPFPVPRLAAEAEQGAAAGSDMVGIGQLDSPRNRLVDRRHIDLAPPFVETGLAKFAKDLRPKQRTAARGNVRLRLVVGPDHDSAHGIAAATGADVHRVVAIGPGARPGR